MNTRFINTVRRGLVVAVAILAVQATAGVSPASARAGVQSGLEKFAADVVINSAFDKVLHRSPDDSERRRYRVRIFEDHWGGSDIEDDLRGRHDYRTYDDRRDSGPYSGGSGDVDRMIRRAYEDILGRRPDPEGLRMYRTNVIDRGWTERQVREALRKSAEYNSVSQSSADRIIERAYQDILGRKADYNGLVEYRNQMMHHGWDEHDVREALKRSPEYRQKNTMSREQAEQIVRRAYRSVLGREADPEGMEGFVQRVLRDHWSESQVARELRNSDEYRNKGR